MSDSTGTQTLESMSQAVWYNRWTVKKFDKYLKGRILEVGCGIGNFTQVLKKYGEVFAIDTEKKYVEKVQKILPETHAEVGDIEKGGYFFKNEKFDCIVCLNVLEHIEKDDNALQNMYGLLKKGGVLILLVPAHDFLYGGIDKSIGHFRRYDKKMLKELLVQVGFNIIRARTLNFLGAVGWFVSSRLLSQNVVDKKGIKIFNIMAPFILSIEDLLEPPIGTSILIIAKK